MEREEKLKMYKAFIVPAYLEGVMKTIKYFERWRMLPKEELITHVTKLAEECAERKMNEMENSKE